MNGANQRLRFLSSLDESIRAAASASEHLAVVVLNLCRFRQINIDYGHAFGDQVLDEVRERLRDALRADDLLFHIGNDEFAIILRGLQNARLVTLAARKLLNAVSDTLRIDDQLVALEAVAGAAVFPDHADRGDSLLVAADTALDVARRGHRHFAVYETLMRGKDTGVANLKSSLRSALDDGGLSLHYQPQLNLQQGVLSGGEALARWHHEEMGWIRPDVFIGVAEQSGLIDTLTYWSLNVALREWFQLHTADASASIAVNLSTRLLHSPELVPMVERSMNIWGACPGSVVLEVTESAMMADPAAALQTLNTLHALGIRLSIDDFGTGYSSLAYLTRLPVSELKIDKSFVSQMVDSRMDRKVVQSVIDLAHSLELEVVAEGIEDQATLDMLVNMGCDYGQGYFIARPMPLAALGDWMKTSDWQYPQTAAEDGALTR